MSAGTALVLLPGLLCDAQVWAHQRDTLQETRPDMPCFVPDYGGCQTITAMAEQVLAQAPAERLCVAGHSMGGRVALELARLAPHRLDRLALLDTGAAPRPTGPEGEAEQMQRLALLAVAQDQGMAVMARQWVSGMVHPGNLDSPVTDAIVAMVARKTPEVFQAQIQALLNRPDARPLLPRLPCPTLLLCGRQDAWSPLPRHQAMQQQIPGAALIVIEDAGHMSTMEQPAAVSAALRHWLSL